MQRPGLATRTIETKGKSSIRRRRTRISSSKLFAHTSRVASRIDAAGMAVGKGFNFVRFVYHFKDAFPADSSTTFE